MRFFIALAIATFSPCVEAHEFILSAGPKLESFQALASQTSQTENQISAQVGLESHLRFEPRHFWLSYQFSSSRVYRHQAEFALFEPGFGSQRWPMGGGLFYAQQNGVTDASLHTVPDREYYGFSFLMESEEWSVNRESFRSLLRFGFPTSVRDRRWSSGEYRWGIDVLARILKNKRLGGWALAFDLSYQRLVFSGMESRGLRDVSDQYFGFALAARWNPLTEIQRLGRSDD